MSVTVSPEELEGAERILSTEDMYRKGLEASLPGAENYNIVEAHKWFNLAAMKGCAQSRVYRKELLLEMTTDQVAEAQRIAREWMSSRRAVMIG
jgi:hypothetical protein